MKQFFLLLTLFACLNLKATIRTVSNNLATVAQYSTIQAAVDAASSGDTIYIHGSPFQYGSTTITEKRLTLIGPGWSPVRSFNPFKAVVQSLTISGTASDNTEINGLVFATHINLSTPSPDNLRFLRNQFKSAVYFIHGATNYSGYIFEGNWFDAGLINATTSSTYSNFIFRNNIFYATSNNGNVYGINGISVLFDHNLFYGPSANSVSVFSGNCTGLLLTNNIFVRRDASSQLTLSTFNNNITFNAGVNNPWSVNGNQGSGNIENQDPQMVDQVAVNNGTNDPLLNFSIAAGPANNTGVDSKDLGLLFETGGGPNWNNCRMSRIPYIYSMLITNSTISAGGTLNVQVEARTQN